jgi:erythritol transport system permease protein
VSIISHDKDAVAAARTPGPRSGQLLTALLRARTLIVLGLVIAVFAGLSSSYLTVSNLELMTQHASINAILAIGVTFVILTGGIDLSVGSIAGLVGMVAGGLLYEGLPLPGGSAIFFSTGVVILIGLLIGAGTGAVNGIVVTRFSVAPFIVTLGMQYAIRGFADLLSNGSTFPDLSGSAKLGTTGFDVVGAGNVLGLPTQIWLMIIIGAVATVVAVKTPFGRRVYAVGGNVRAAQLSGIRTRRVTIAVYVISGACAALAGLILTSQLGAAFPDTATGYELNAIAAAVLGGTSLSGGQGSIPGTIVGAFIIGFLNDGLVLINVSSFWQQVIIGVVIVLAVIFDQAQRRLSTAISRRLPHPYRPPPKETHPKGISPCPYAGTRADAPHAPWPYWPWPH